MSIKAHRLERRDAGTVGGPEDSDVLVLSLRGGGEMTVDPSMITQITPDEVPYPEPEPIGGKPDAAIGDGNGRVRPDVAAYAGIIDRVSKEQGVDARLVRAVIQVESAYCRAVSGISCIRPIAPLRDRALCWYADST